MSVIVVLNLWLFLEVFQAVLIIVFDPHFEVGIRSV